MHQSAVDCFSYAGWFELFYGRLRAGAAVGSGLWLPVPFSRVDVLGGVVLGGVGWIRPLSGPLVGGLELRGGRMQSVVLPEWYDWNTENSTKLGSKTIAHTVSFKNARASAWGVGPQARRKSTPPGLWDSLASCQVLIHHAYEQAWGVVIKSLLLQNTGVVVLSSHKYPKSNKRSLWNRFLQVDMECTI